MALTHEQAIELYDKWQDTAYDAVTQTVTDLVPDEFYCYCGPCFGRIFIEKEQGGSNGGWSAFLDYVVQCVLEGLIYEGADEETVECLDFDYLAAEAEEAFGHLDIEEPDEAADVFKADMEAAKSVDDLIAIDKKYDLSALGDLRSRDVIEEEYQRQLIELESAVRKDLVEQKIIRLGYKKVLADERATWFFIDRMTGEVDFGDAFDEESAFDVCEWRIRMAFGERYPNGYDDEDGDLLA